jgi:trigger factor
METQVKDVNEYTKELIVSITKEEKKQYDKEALKKVRKRVEIPGFRKGRVPEHLVRTQYAYEIEAESISLAMDDLYPKAIDELKLPVVAPGKLKDVESEGDQVQFIFEVVVEPDIELKKVEGLKVKKVKAELKDEHVNQTLEELRERYATVLEKEEGAEEGDTLEMDLQEVDENNIPIVGKKYEDMSVEIGKNQLDEDLEKQLIGLRAGESKIISKIYPDDYEDEAWRGKKEFFKVDVKKVLQKEKPELDDDFAQTVSDRFNNLKDLIDDIRSRLQENLEKQEKESLYHEIVHQMIEENPFEVPEEMVENYLDHIVEDVKRQYGNAKIDDNILRQYYRQNAETSVKWYLIKKKIIETKGLTVSEEEVFKKLDEIPSLDENTKNQLKQYPAYLNSIREDLLEEKVFEYILEHAEIEEVSPEEAMVEEKGKKGENSGAKKKGTKKKTATSKKETNKKKSTGESTGKKSEKAKKAEEENKNQE